MKIWLPESNVNLQLVRNKERGELAWQRPSQVPNVFGLHYISMTEVDYCLFACWPVLWTGISVRPPFISDGNAWWVRQVQTKRRQASRRAYQSHGRRRLEKPPTWTMPQLWSWPLTTSTWLWELLSSRQRIRICLPCYCKRRLSLEIVAGQQTSIFQQAMQVFLQLQSWFTEHRKESHEDLAHNQIFLASIKAICNVTNSPRDFY